MRRQDREEARAEGRLPEVKPAALLARLAEGRFNNVDFRDLVNLAPALGFELDRIRGSHQIYVHSLYAAG